MREIAKLIQDNQVKIKELTTNPPEKSTVSLDQTKGTRRFFKGWLERVNPRNLFGKRRYIKDFH